MFSEVELQRFVAIPAENLDGNRLVCQLITRLLEILLHEKTSESHGYLLAVTGLKDIGRGKIQEDSGFVFFPIAFTCRTFIPFRGEVLQGVVYHIGRVGVFLRCGPMKYAYLSAQKMPNYSYVSGENPYFFNDDELTKIETDVVVCFFVLAVRWSIREEFEILASIEGESLGPVSLSGTDELDL